MRSLKKNFLLTSLYQIFYVITPLVTTPYISRVLGAENIGDYSFAYSVANYFALFIRLGVLTYGNRTIAMVRDDKRKMSHIFCEIYCLQVSCGVVFTVLYILWVMLFAPQTNISIILIPFVLSAVVDVTWLLYGVEDFVVTTARDICVRLFTVICIFGFVKTINDLWIYTFIQSIGYLLGQLLGWYRLKKHIYYIRPSKSGVLSHLKPDLILFVPSIAVSLYKTMDKLMLGAISGSIELGYYESSERVINLPMALITALATVMLPRMSNLIANDATDEKVRKIIDKSLILTTFISTLLCFGIMSVGNMFVPMFYGNGYEKCIDLYNWLLPSCVFLAFANVLRTQYLLPQKQDKQFIISLFIGAGVNLVLNFFLIPLYASVGAAIATLAAEASVCIVQMGFTWKDLKISKEIMRVSPFVIAGIGMFIFFGDRVVKISAENDNMSRMISLFIKIIECGMGYVIIAGVIIGGWRMVKKFKHSTIS